MPDDNSKDQQVDMKKVLEGLSTMAQGMQAMQETMTNLPTAINEGISSSLSSIQQNQQRSPSGEDEDDDADLTGSLEEMSRADFASFIVQNAVKAIKKDLKGVQEKVSSVEESSNRNALLSQLKDLSEKNPDLKEWTKEMQQIAKDTPGISPARALALAKAENPDKVKELADKYKSDDSNDKGNEDTPNTPNEQKKQKFGGFTPTSGQTDRKTDMSKEEAAEAAWDEVMGVLQTEEQLPAAS